MNAKRVLIADDDSGLRRALGRRCESLGLTVISVSDGLDALSSICKDAPDMAILDVNMPAADGLAVCQKLTTDPDIPPIPVIFLTGVDDPQMLARCESLGAHYIQKGVDAWDQLEPILRELLDLNSDETIGGFPTGVQRSFAKSDFDRSAAPMVLTIDDDPDISKAISVRLKQYGIKTLRALSGMQGYWTALKHKPHVIISDFRMPDVNGNYVLGRLRTHALTKNTPVIILTGKTIGANKDFALERELLSLGAASFLTKPIDFDALLDELREHITIPDKPVSSHHALSR